MNETTRFTAREAFPVTIGSVTMYCEKFRASAARRFAEESTVTGDDVFTNESPRSMEMTFSGRICVESSPLLTLLNAYNTLRRTNTNDILYRGLVFRNCHMKSFTIEDCGLDYVELSLTAITADDIETESDAK